MENGFDTERIGEGHDARVLACESRLDLIRYALPQRIARILPYACQEIHEQPAANTPCHTVTTIELGWAELQTAVKVSLLKQ